MTMHRRRARITSVRSLALAAAILLCNFADGSAADFCINYNGGGCNYVGKNFKGPRPGKCRAWLGVGTPICFGAHNAQTGTACTASDGSNVHFTITATGVGGGPLITSIDLPLPALTGGTGVACNNAGGCFPFGTLDRVECSAVPVP